MSKLETNQVDPATGTTLTLGTSGDTISIPSGVTLANSGTATGFPDNKPLFYASLSANQSISANTWTKITLDQEVFDADGVFASNKFTAPSAGKYFFVTSVRCNSPNTNENFQSALYKNGSYFNGVGNAREYSPNGDEILLKCSVILSLAQNDYIELYARAGGAGEDVAGSTAGSGEESYTAMQGMKIIE